MCSCFAVFAFFTFSVGMFLLSSSIKASILDENFDIENLRDNKLLKKKNNWYLQENRGHNMVQGVGGVGGSGAIQPGQPFNPEQTCANLIEEISIWVANAKMGKPLPPQKEIDEAIALLKKVSSSFPSSNAPYFKQIEDALKGHNFNQFTTKMLGLADFTISLPEIGDRYPRCGAAITFLAMVSYSKNPDPGPIPGTGPEAVLNQISGLLYSYAQQLEESPNPDEQEIKVFKDASNAIEDSPINVGALNNAIREIAPYLKMQ